MSRQRTLQTDRMPENTRKSKLPERRITRADVIAEKLQGSTVSAFDVKRSLKFARDTSLSPEDRVKIIDALSIPNNDVLPKDWSSAVLGSIAKKDNEPEVREAAKRTLFYRNRR